jgi:molybdopterin-guanine dinucleotide biosynthesis protein A
MSERCERRGGIILAGGHSHRMGTPKPWLPFGDELMLPRVVRLLGEAVDKIIVVAAQGQELPSMPDTVSIVYDERPDRGPLEALAGGLNALDETTTCAYVTGCDTPLLRPEFVARMFKLLGAAQSAVLRIDNRYQPLAAVYRREVRTAAAALLTEDCSRVWALFDRVPTRVVTADELRDVDPRLDSLRGCNTPAEYQTLLAAKDETSPP